jgi:thioredoxin-dependent peroxiredoxin
MIIMIDMTKEAPPTIRDRPWVGDIAPDFSFIDSGGKTIKLSAFRNKKKIVLYFYPKDFTPGCTTEAMEFTRDYQKFLQVGIEIIGVSPDNLESHRKFQEKMNIPYLLAADDRNEISRRYGVYGPKSFMGKNYDGVNRTSFLIDEGGVIVKVFTKVKPLGHSEEILKAFGDAK